MTTNTEIRYSYRLSELTKHKRWAVCEERIWNSGHRVIIEISWHDTEMVAMLAAEQLNKKVD